MDRTACINLPEFPVQLLLRRHPDWKNYPVAVVDADKPQGEILQVNECARSFRILPGMRYAAGLSLSGILRAAVVPDKDAIWCFEVSDKPAAVLQMPGLSGPSDIAVKQIKDGILVTGVSSGMSKGRIEIFTSDGRRIDTPIVRNRHGRSDVYIGTVHMASGVYFIRLKATNNMYVLRVCLPHD